MIRSNTKRILVTGGAGFLGSHLCERLVEAGEDVICVDNFFTGDKRNIAHLLGRANFELIRHDVTFPLYMEVDEIYNLACPASPVHYQHDPVRQPKPAFTVQSICWGWPNALGPEFFRPLPVRCTEIQRCIPNRKVTGVE